MSIHTNADSSVTEKDRAEDEALMKIGTAIEKQIEDTPTEGQGYQPVEFVKDRENVVTEAMLKDERKEEFAPVIPAGYEYDLDNRVVWKLSPYHYEMVMQGKVCHACLEWQSPLAQLSGKCTWKDKYEGCGADHIQGNNSSSHYFFGRDK